MSPRMKWTLIILGLLWIFAFFGGNFLHDKPHANTIALDTEVQIPRDIPLQITQSVKNADGSWSITAETTYKRKPAGFRIVTGSQWKWLKVGGPKNTVGDCYAGKVSFRSLGEESDRLLEMLNEDYHTQLAPKPMTKKVEFTGLAIEGDPQDLKKSLVKIDMLFSPKSAENYAEFYIYIDLPQSRLNLGEQDKEYRKPMLQALRGELELQP